MLRNSVIYFFMRGGTGLANIVVVSLFSRLLSPAQYGQYSLLVTCATMAAAIGFQWLNTAVVRAIPAGAAGELLATARRDYWRVSLLLVVLASVVAGVIALGSGPLMAGAALATVVVAMLQGRFELALQVFVGQGNPLRFGTISWARSLGILALGTAGILLGFQAAGALAGHASAIALALILFDPVRRQASGQASAGISASLWHYGMPLTFGFVSQAILGLADRPLIAWMLGTEQLGPYAAAYDFVQQIIGAVTNVMLLASYPMLVRAFEERGPMAAADEMRRVTRAHLGVSFPLAVATIGLAPHICGVIFGQAFRATAVAVFPVLVIAILLNSLKSYLCDIPAMLMRRTRQIMWTSVGMSLLILPLLFLLVPRFGVVGAAWAGLISFFCGLAGSYLLSPRELRPRVALTDALKCLLTWIAMFAAARAVRLDDPLSGLLLGTVAAGCAYLLAAYLLNPLGFRGQLAEILRRAKGRTI